MRTVAAVAILWATAGGCDRGGTPAPPPAPQPTAASQSPASPAQESSAQLVSATTAPSTGPAAAQTQPTASVMTVNGQSAIFPAARLRVETDDEGRVSALLFSDDPREALKDNYTGNSFYLKMDLDVASAAELPGAQWNHQAPSSAEREDTPYGVFLTGRKVQLQPSNVRAAFRQDAGGAMTCYLSGQFTVIDATTAPRGPAQVVQVSAELPVRVETRVARGD